MTKAELEKQLKKCEKLLKKFTKCRTCCGSGKHGYWESNPNREYDCYACHGSGAIHVDIAAYWNTKK